MTCRSRSSQDVGELIQLMAGATPTPDLVESVFSHTQGNPLFVTEVVRLLVQDPELTQDGLLGTASGGLGLPDGVREAISGRLIRLSDACNQALTTASVIGREFGLDQLEQVNPDDSEVFAENNPNASNPSIVVSLEGFREASPGGRICRAGVCLAI